MGTSFPRLPRPRPDKIHSFDVQLRLSPPTTSTTHLTKRSVHDCVDEGRRVLAGLSSCGADESSSDLRPLLATSLFLTSAIVFVAFSSLTSPRSTCLPPPSKARSSLPSEFSHLPSPHLIGDVLPSSSELTTALSHRCPSYLYSAHVNPPSPGHLHRRRSSLCKLFSSFNSLVLAS